MKTTLLLLSVFLSTSLFGQTSNYSNWTSQDKEKCILDSEKSMNTEDDFSIYMLEIYEVNSMALSECKCDYLEKKWKDFETYNKEGRSDMVMNAELIKNAMTNCINDDSKIDNWSDKMQLFCKKELIIDRLSILILI